MRKLLFAALMGIFVLQWAACVPARKFEDQQALTEKYKLEKEQCQNDLTDAQNQLELNQEKIKQLTKNVNYLVEDTSAMGIKYRKISKLNDDLNELYEQVIEQNKALVSTSSAEKQELTVELAEKEKLLNEKEAELDELSETLKQKEQELDDLSADLEEREARVAELEAIISKQDSAVTALKTSITNALTGFGADELTVEIKDGKVYVSLSEKLLFKSGSSTVDTKGKDALSKLANVLSLQPEVNVMVEGHTDNVPYKSSSGPIKDNWDLSVLRATSVVRILVDNGLPETQVIPSGRGEFVPVASNATTEGKAKNRRTEIILTPNLEELFQILESN